MNQFPAAPYRNPGPEEEKQSLKNRADALQSELDSIRKRMETMEEEPSGT